MLRVNDRVLCFHGPLLYEAKILKTANWQEGNEREEDQPLGVFGPHYFVHYKGWKATWDEWVPVDRALEWTDENLRTQHELKAAMTAASEKKRKSSERKRDSITSKVDAENPKEASALRGQKRSRENDAVDKEEDFGKRTEIRIHVPDILKERLVDDWENITKSHQLISLPRDPNVTSILADYRRSAPTKRAGSAESDIFDEILAGIKLYFDRSLGNILLYRFERQQYLEIRKTNGDIPASEIYGAEHLLRLFVTMPELIAHTNMDQPSVYVLRRHLEDFLSFLARKREELFLTEYVNASPNYEGLARGS